MIEPSSGHETHDVANALETTLASHALDGAVKTLCPGELARILANRHWWQ